MKLIFSPKCLEYQEPGHPESPERLRKAYGFLKDKYEFLEPQPASEVDLLRVHTRRLLEAVKNLDFADPDCPHYPNIYEYAKLSAGAAMLAAKENAFSLMRPPGHHAGRDRVAGFCYFNNIAVAVKSINKKTLIIDIDGHHGDGTQEIFFKDDQVIYISLHSFPNYPGTGRYCEANCYNYPLSALCGDERYLKTLDEALSLIDLKRIEQIAVSAGFDAYFKDPLASLGLSSQCYRRIGRRIADLNLPVFAVLEGGYVAEDLGPNIFEFLQGLEER